MLGDIKYLARLHKGLGATHLLVLWQRIKDNEQVHLPFKKSIVANIYSTANNIEYQQRMGYILFTNTKGNMREYNWLRE